MAERLDSYLVSSGLAGSRERAKNMIKNGLVTVNGSSSVKPSMPITDNDTVTAGEDLKYVGRGALKLKKAFEIFPISVKGAVCADIGASTGGFTEIMLENGASKVYAVDVGHDQLDEKLCRDSRVVNMEGTNVRDLTPSHLGESIAFMSVDLSFISLTNVSGVMCSLLAEDGEAVILIKPQFEAGKSAVGKNGIVKDQKDHIRVLESLIAHFSSLGMGLQGLTYSPVTGGSGNIEYLAYLKKGAAASAVIDLKELVKTSFSQLREK